MKAINIEWDIGDEEDIELEDLPTEVEIPKGMTDEDEISDWLLDEYGFCHYGFELTDVEAGVINNFNISEIAYELYKQDWIDTHTTKEMRMNVLRGYYTYVQDCIEEDFDIDSFEEYSWESGYGEGEIYVCYDEFLDNEYLEKDYIKELLNDDNLYELYLKDLENLDNEEDDDEDW